MSSLFFFLNTANYMLLNPPTSHEYNPSLGDDCSGLYVGWYVCVGTQSKTSSSIGWSTSATNASIPAPTEFKPPPATFVQNFTAEPHQSGIPDSCGNFYRAQNVRASFLFYFLFMNLMPEQRLTDTITGRHL